MSDSPFVIRSRSVLLAGEREVRPAALLIRNGLISKILAYDDLDGNLPVIEGGALTLMPGVFDTHAHINEPGRTDWEGFQTATRAAAAGGITSLIDMPLNSIPATTSLWALEEKKKTAAGKCAIRYGFWGGVVPGNAQELRPMAAAGALGFKCFLVESGVEEFPMSTEADLRIAMPILADLGLPLLVHAELECGNTENKGDSRAYKTYLDSRPDAWEVEAIRMMIRLSRETNCAVHIVHLSSAIALADIAAAKKEGVKISVETCPHYLFFTAEEIVDGATEFKCAPPIREKKNKERLWEGLIDGTIDFIVSDHSPCLPKLKSLETGSFESAWGGISGLQFSMPVVWTEMRRRGLSIAQLSAWMSEKTARFAGQSDLIGEIREGMVADFVLWDPNAELETRASEVHHRHKLTPYANLKLFGKVHQTIVAGKTIYNSGKFHDTKTAHPFTRTINGQ